MAFPDIQMSDYTAFDKALAEREMLQAVVTLPTVSAEQRSILRSLDLPR